MFIETLIDSATDWFYHLDDGSITNWNTLRTTFEARFKTIEDEHVLLTQLTSIKKKPTMSMRDFTASFNKIVNMIPIAARQTVGNLMTFFISVMPPDINYDLRRAHPTDLADAQKKAIESEDDLISTRKWKQELHTKGSSSSTTSSEEMIQKLSNELGGHQEAIT